MSRAAAALALALAGACRPAPPPALQITDESAKRRAGDDNPRSSPVFDGERLRLRAVRGETLGLEVLLAGGAPQAVALSPLGDGVTRQAFAVDLVTVREGSTAMYGRARGPGSYPDRLRPVAQPVSASDQVFLDVAIAADAAPGRRTGELAVGARRIPVELTILPLAIDLAAAPLVWVWYAPAELARAHGVADDDGAAELALEASYAALFRAHGAYLASDLPLARLVPRAATLDPTIRYWPVAVDKRDPARIEAEARDLAGFFAGRPQTPFTMTLDEPRTVFTRLTVRSHGEAVHRGGGGKLLFAVTDVPSPLYGDAIDVFIHPHAAAHAESHRWTYNGRPPEAGSMIIDTDGSALRSWGWIAARYQIELWYVWEGLYFTDRYNGAAVATDLMQQPITFDQRRRGGEDHGNGDGVLVYPGPLPSLRLKALRRGLEDRLLIAQLAACDPARANAIVSAVVPRALDAGFAEPSWPGDGPRWDQARAEVLDALLACRHE